MFSIDIYLPTKKKNTKTPLKLSNMLPNDTAQVQHLHSESSFSLFQTRPDSEGQVLYSLYGVIQHSGNMNSGHYTACVKVREPPVKGLYDKITSMSELTEFIKNMWTVGKTGVKHGNSRCRHEPAPDGQWFHVSDASVVAIAETKVLKSQAYMLFYGRLPLGSR